MLFQRRTAGDTLIRQRPVSSSRSSARKKMLLSILTMFGLVILSASSLFLLPFQHTRAQSSYPRPALGTNLGANTQLFTDAMKTARPTWDFTGDGDCPLDAKGWPTKDCGVYVWEGQDKNDGTYSLSFTGQATVDVSLGYATVQNLQYDTVTNTSTATLVVTDTGAQNFHLNFTNTKRTASSATGTGVTDIKLYKPIAEGSSTTFDPSQIFTPWYKNAVAPYDYLRFMAGTNWNKSTNWSDRTTVDSATQNKRLPGESTFENNLIAYEYMVEFANQTGKDLFLTVPNRANDDYVTKLAQLLLYGSDGINPYTSPQSNPVWKPLNSSQKVYFEYTNEAWNFVFDQGHDIADAATAEVQSNPSSPLKYDGNINSDVIRFRAYARRSLEMSDLFRQVFGNSAMGSRVRPILSWQYDNLNNTAEEQLEFLNNYYNNADGVQHVTNPHPVSYYFWGGGGAVYYQSNNDSAGSVDGIYNSGIPSDDYAKILQVESLWAHLYGLRFMAYEGGFAVGGDGSNGAQSQSRVDPRAKQSMLDSFAIFAAAGGDAYTTGTYAQWIDPKQASSYPLVQAAATITSSQSSPTDVTRGQVLSSTSPTIIAGPHYDVSRSWQSGPTSNLGKSVGYLLRTDNNGTYQVALNLSNTASGGKFNVYLDGALLSTIDVPSGTKQTVVVGSATLSTGLHGLILRAAANASSGNAGTIEAVIIQPGTGTPPGLPALGALPSGWQSQDVGTVGKTGSASYNNNTFNLLASGGDISGTADEFHYAYQYVSGNGTLVAHVTFESNSDNYAKAGVMIRDSLQGDAKHASTFLFGTGGAVLNDRTATTGQSGQVGPVAGYYPYWVKIERSGSTFTSSVSQDGTTWKQVGTATISMADSVYVGLAFSAHNNSLLGAADFDTVSVTGFTGAQNQPTPTPGTTPTPTSTATSGASIPLSSLNWTSASAGYGDVQKDKSSNGNTITLRGTTYPKGIGTHAASEVVYNLNGAYKTFNSDIGIDDEAWSNGSVVFQIYADGVKVFDSGVVNRDDAVQHVSLNITSVNELKLVVGDAGNGNASDHADWAGASLSS